MDILKVQTENARAAQVFTFRGGKRQSLESVNIEEVWALSQEGRLAMFTGKEVAALGDSQLEAGLGNHSYYFIQPITI